MGSQELAAGAPGRGHGPNAPPPLPGSPAFGPLVTRQQETLCCICLLTTGVDTCNTVHCQHTAQFTVNTRNISSLSTHATPFTVNTHKFTVNTCNTVHCQHTQHRSLSTHTTLFAVNTQHSSLSTHATQFTVNTCNTVRCQHSTVHCQHTTQFTVNTRHTVHCQHIQHSSLENSKCALHWHQVRAHSRHCLQSALIFSSQHAAPEDYQPLSSNLHAKLSPGPTVWVESLSICPFRTAVSLSNMSSRFTQVVPGQRSSLLRLTQNPSWAGTCFPPCLSVEGRLR